MSDSARNESYRQRLGLEGRVAVVTGGARGIGQAAASPLHEMGATCVLADVLDEQGERAAAELTHTGPRVSYSRLDVTDPEAARQAFAHIAEEYGRLDVLVTSAGVEPHGSSLDVTEQAWQRALDVKVNGTFWCAREAIRHMGESGGSGVAIGSISGEIAHVPQAKSRSSIRVMTLGGRVRPESYVEVDAWTLERLANLKFDVAFVGTNALDSSWSLSTPDPAEAAVKRAIRDATRRPVLLADHTKIGGVAACRYAALTAINILIADEGADQDALDEIRSTGVEVVIAT